MCPICSDGDVHRGEVRAAFNAMFEEIPKEEFESSGDAFNAMFEEISKEEFESTGDGFPPTPELIPYDTSLYEGPAFPGLEDGEIDLNLESAPGPRVPHSG
jgi:hypothetical protein